MDLLTLVYKGNGNFAVRAAAHSTMCSQHVEACLVRIGASFVPSNSGVNCEDRPRPSSLNARGRCCCPLTSIGPLAVPEAGINVSRYDDA